MIKPKSFAQAFSKACSFQRQSLWSLSAESETLLGFAQHFFFPNRRILSADKFLLLSTLVPNGGQSPPFKGKRC
ncbi:hypothetical protein [Pseudoruminococcus massiliensis]|jgi:hypothetical protein|uniref:hypothetical protein n=1 Tax=Pseudoruminococcus massiliensis TaxID=2086583 RepID=UPI00402971E6